MHPDKLIKFRAFCFSLLLLACALHISAAPPPPVVQVENGVHVTLEIDKTEIVTGEAIHIKITATNVDAPIRLGVFGYRPYFTEGNDIEITVQRGRELPYRYEATDPPGDFSTREFNLEWGDSAHEEFALVYDKTHPSGYLFAEPGEYPFNVKVHYSVIREPQKNTIQLPPLTIRVREPEGTNAAAWELLNFPEMARAMHMLTSEDATVLETARKVAEDYPDSVYAPACLYISAAQHMRGENPDFKKGIEAFLGFLQKYPEHIRASGAIFNIVFAHQRLQLHELGRDWFYYLKDFDPGYRLLRPENSTAFYYYYGPLQNAKGRRWWLYPKPWELEVPER